LGGIRVSWEVPRSERRGRKEQGPWAWGGGELAMRDDGPMGEGEKDGDGGGVCATVRERDAVLLFFWLGDTENARGPRRRKRGRNAGNGWNCGRLEAGPGLGRNRGLSDPIRIEISLV
jgi:hypothetical protein